MTVVTSPSIAERLWFREQHETGSAGTGYITGLIRLYEDELTPDIIREGPGKIVELGTWTGNSAFAWLSCLHSSHSLHNKDDRLWTIDTNQDNSGPLVEDAKRYGWTERLVCVKADSIEYAKEWTGLIDLLYVDTDHEYLQVRREIEAWIGHIRQGGFIILDDAVEYPAVHEAFDYCAGVSCKDRIASFTLYTGLPYTPKNHGLILARLK